MHDAGHQLVDRLEAILESLAPLRRQFQARRTDEDREQDQRQHVAEHVALVADERTEQVARHEHLDDRCRRHRRPLGALRHMLLRLPAVLLDQARRGFLVEPVARLQDVHHDEPEGRGDRHVHEKERERAAGERTEVGEFAQLHHAARERREHQRDHDEEQHAQENLAERIADRGGEPARAVEDGRRRAADGEHDHACDGRKQPISSPPMPACRSEATEKPPR